MRMAVPTYYTAEMLRALPDDGKRYEVVHGELLVTPAPRAWHQVVLSRLFEALTAYLRTEPLGLALTSPADISWAPDVMVQPDLFVVPLEEARVLDWRAMRTLLLAIEVLSPTTARADRFTKRRVYQEAGVATYWVVDGEERLVDVWTPDAIAPLVERARLMWQPSGARRALMIELAELFRPL